MREGKRHHHAVFTVHYRANQSGRARLGIAVGRRVSRLATRRNLIKRILRECFRHQASTLPALDLVFNVRPAADSATPSEFAQAVHDALQQLKRHVTRAAST